MPSPIHPVTFDDHQRRYLADSIRRESQYASSLRRPPIDRTEAAFRRHQRFMLARRHTAAPFMI